MDRYRHRYKFIQFTMTHEASFFSNSWSTCQYEHGNQNQQKCFTFHTAMNFLLVFLCFPQDLYFICEIFCFCFTTVSYEKESIWILSDINQTLVVIFGEWQYPHHIITTLMMKPMNRRRLDLWFLLSSLLCGELIISLMWYHIKKERQ